MHVPGHLRDNIIDLGFIPTQDKYDAFSAALFLCQPSTNESFSIVLMESWLCNRPVLVHADCNVTKDFVNKSQGGLLFSDYKEFAGCLDYFLSQPERGNEMGNNGRSFVFENFNNLFGLFANHKGVKDTTSHLAMPKVYLGFDACWN